MRMAEKMARWSDHEILKFLELYEKRPCLWNPNIDEYRNVEKRSEALRWIIAKLDLKMSENDIRNKIKNIRTTYGRTLKKIKKAQKCGLGDDDFYLPSLLWFKKADGFLRASTETGMLKKEEKKLLLSTRRELSPRSSTSKYQMDEDEQVSESGEEDDDDDDNTTADIESEEEDFQKQIRNTYMQLESMESTTETSDRSLKKLTKKNHQEEATEADHVSGSTKIEERNKYLMDTLLAMQQELKSLKAQEASKRCNETVIDNTATERSIRLASTARQNPNSFSPNISQQETFVKKRKLSYVSANTNEEDEFDTFTRHIGNQLRQLPLERALRCQGEIHSLLMKERIEHVSAARDKQSAAGTSNQAQNPESQSSVAHGQGYQYDNFSYALKCLDD